MRVTVNNSVAIESNYRCRLLLVGLGLLLLVCSTSIKAEATLFRIGTGGTAGTYHPIGSLIAQAVGQSVQLQAAESSSANLIMLAQRSPGSETNVLEINEGLLESALVQADVAHWAYNGVQPFDGSPPLTQLRAIATLYLESIHLVAHVDSDINGVTDLAGRRVSVDEVGSGTQLDVRPILESRANAQDKLQMVYLKPADSIDRLRQGQLDAFFIIAGYPVVAVSELVSEGIAKVIPITDINTELILEQYPFFTLNDIPAGVYGNSQAIPTLGVAAQWIVDAELDDELVFRLTEALFSDSTQQILTEGHPKGQEVRVESALVGMGIPLHAGAERFYQARGMQVPDFK